MRLIKATKIWMIFLSVGLLFSACNEDDILPDPTGSDDTPTAPNPVPGPGDGAFWGIKSITTVTNPVTVDTEVGTAVAIFTDDDFNSFVDAGDVQVLGADLDQNDNKSYVYIPGITQPLGLQFTSDYEWSVSGAGSVSAFTHTVDFPFPTLGVITSEATVEKGDGYTLTCESVSRADSVIYMVGNALKTVGGDVTSVTFTADELKNVSTGTSFVQVAAYTYRPETINSKTYYFGNETVRSQVVEIK